MSKSFQFPLQKVLDVREIREDQKTVELKKAQITLQKEQQTLDYLNNRKDQILQNHSIEKSDGRLLNSLKLHQSMDYIFQIDSEIGAQKKVIHTQEKQVEKNHTELLHAVKDKKIVEKLKEKQMTDYTKKNRKKERVKENEVAIRISLKKCLSTGSLK